jgi:flagellar basal-body rod modification protein FlgD
VIINARPITAARDTMPGTGSSNSTANTSNTSNTSNASGTSNDGNGAITQAAGGQMGKDQFVQLLVTEMKNQDPLNPMDGKELAVQLAQFSSVEQLMNANTKLDNLTATVKAQGSMIMGIGSTSGSTTTSGTSGSSGTDATNGAAS